jgi:protein tyrosine phosphatase (PTP) superfamily phosphohydrolase (DUF442 family)
MAGIYTEEFATGRKNSPVMGLVLALGWLLLAAVGNAATEPAPDIDEILNFRPYSDTFASSGQPTAVQFSLVSDAGFDRVINLGFSDREHSVAAEDRLVKNLGMDYLQIPVDSKHPKIGDFYAFADAMQRDSSRKTLLHCRTNGRASAFGFLYRVIYQDVPVEQAKADMNSVWQPNEVWRNFIFEVLAQNNISPFCEACDWTPPAANQ